MSMSIGLLIILVARYWASEEEEADRACSTKWVFLKTLQNS